jgi:retinol dehydrogenase-12
MKILITGGTSGIGLAAVKILAQQNHEIILLARNPKKVDFKENNIEIVPTDLSSIKSILEATKQIRAKHQYIDVLINNAGVWLFEFTETPDGIEQTFQVNVIAPILLTQELLPLLKKSSAPRVITTSSGLHQGKINIDDLEYRHDFSGFKAYRQSKLCEIVWTRYMSKKEKDIFWATLHPGVIKTDLVRTGGFFSKLFFKIFGKSPEKGAETIIHLVEEKLENLKSGEYYKNRKLAKTDTLASYDLRLAPQLLQKVEKMIEKAKSNE